MNLPKHSSSFWFLNFFGNGRGGFNFGSWFNLFSLCSTSSTCFIFFLSKLLVLASTLPMEENSEYSQHLPASGFYWYTKPPCGCEFHELANCPNCFYKFWVLNWFLWTSTANIAWSSMIYYSVSSTFISPLLETFRLPLFY